MKKKYKILLILLVLAYPIYKGVRELFWVKHGTYTFENNLTIKIRTDIDMIGFQDYNCDNTITIINDNTKAKLKVSYVSLESDLYFFIKELNNVKTLAIVDRFAGQNVYDYTTLKLIGNNDCFKEFGGCGGYNDDSFAALGKPTFIYDSKGFHQ